MVSRIHFLPAVAFHLIQLLARSQIRRHQLPPTALNRIALGVFIEQIAWDVRKIVMLAMPAHAHRIAFEQNRARPPAQMAIGLPSALIP